MRRGRAGLLGVLILLGIVSSAEARQPLDAGADSVSCYQNGQEIFKTQERIRSFDVTGAMSLLAEFSLGQVQDTNIRLYAGERADIVCVVAKRK
jgi:hypothetical protein